MPLNPQPQDKNGALLKIGDRVRLEGRLVQIYRNQEDDRYLAVEVEHSGGASYVLLVAPSSVESLHASSS